MTLTDFPDSQVLSSFCSAAPGEPYWLFRVLRGEVARVHRLSQFVCDWPAKAEWERKGLLEDREPLLSIARKRASFSNRQPVATKSGCQPRGRWNWKIPRPTPAP
jgi:hypothetical protein